MTSQRRREYLEAKEQVPGVTCENEHQKEVFTNAYYAACEIIGGTENITYDYPEDSSEYKDAQNYLANHQLLVDDIYSSAMSSEYGCGYSGPGGSYVKHLRFAGKDWTRNAIEEIVKAMGY